MLGLRVALDWIAQPASPGALRAECAWSGSPATGGKIAAAMRSWSMVRFEVTEDASPGNDGERILHVPGRGVHRSAVSANGDLVVGEMQLRELYATASSVDDVRHKLDTLLGAAWDADLEPYRHAGDGAPVTWLYQVG